MTHTKADATSPRKLTRDEFFALYKEGPRVELVYGDVIPMSPQSVFHMGGVSKLFRAIEEIFDGDYWVIGQGTIEFRPDVVLDPDVSVVAGTVDHWLQLGVNPSSVLLAAEVSYSSLRLDRTRKSSLYASVGVADYWILNVEGRQLEVYRRPVADPAAPFGFRYADVTVVGEDGSVAPLAAPHAAIAVAGVLPG